MALVLNILACTAGAEESGTIKGKVMTTLTRAPLIGANVSVVGTNLGATTNNDGEFVIGQVQEGVYKLRTAYIGYTPALQTDVRVVRNKSTYVEVELAEEYIQMEGISAVQDNFQISKESPVSNFTYSMEEINRSPGAGGDIFRAIETLPGVSSGGGEFSAFSVRGNSPTENIILVDNIPMDRLTHFEGGTEEAEAQGGRFSVFAPKLIREANFQAGGFSARYGGKHASFIDMKIRDGNHDNFTANGSFDILGWEFNYDGPTYVLSSTSLVLSARGIDFKRVLNMLDRKDEGDPSYADFIVKTATTIDERNTLSVLGLYSPEKVERTIDHVYESDRLSNTWLVDNTRAQSVVGVNWQYLPDGKALLQNTLYYRGLDIHERWGRASTDPLNGVVPSMEQAPQRRNIFQKDQEEKEFGVRSACTLMPVRNINLTVGLDLNSTTLDYATVQHGPDTLYVYDRNDARPDTSQLYIVRLPEHVNARYLKSRYSAAAYTELSLSLGDAFVLNPGVRYERNEFNSKDYVSPRFSATCALDPRTQLSLAAGLYHQAPAIAVIVADPVNESLNNEKSVHLILGLTRTLADDLKVTVEGYYKSFDDLLVRQDRTTARRTNAGDGWASGIDVSLVKRFVDKFYGQINYSYAQSKRNDHDGSGEYNADFNQPHIFNILAGYELNEEWSFSAKWKYATGRPADSYILHADIFNNPSFVRYSKEITGNNGRRLDDFHTLNIRVDYRKQLGRCALVTFVDVMNVYDRLNPSEERLIEKTGEVKKIGFRMIPTFGLKLEL
jgi:hypothetical protein